MGKHPKELSRETLEMFSSLVPDAETEIADSQAKVTVDGKEYTLRVKRAASIANQIQVWRGEPIVIHVPDAKSGDRWYVLPISWQMKFAREHSLDARQHASHAFDCMMIAERDLPEEHRVSEDKLMAACEAAVREATSKHMRGLVKAITRARAAVANALIESFEEDFFD